MTIKDQYKTNPEKFDFTDIPPTLVVVPENEQRREDGKPDWLIALANKANAR